jgi:valyl-tRNA synthetase
MIMAGLEYEGEIPFRNVFYTSIIRDKQGRKMSKSLGNSPDPLDLIAAYGADGLRFGLLRISPTGTDVKFDEAQIKEGRNFATKLWNACRFRMMQGPTGSPEITDFGGVNVFGIDILAKLDALAQNMNQALADYEFNTATAHLYEFFWSNYCDLYLEAVKGDPNSATLAVQDTVLRRFVMQLHPMMPHITEEIWEKLGYAQSGEFLMETQLPATPVLATVPPAAVQAAQEQASAVYATATRARNLKAEYKVGANKNVSLVLKPSPVWKPEFASVLKLLAGAAEITVDPAYAPPTGTPAALTDLGELYLPLEGLIDVEAEKSRLGKEIAKITADIEKTEQNLTNPNFLKAPEAVVATHRQRVEDFKAKRAQLEQMLAKLGV